MASVFWPAVALAAGSLIGLAIERILLSRWKRFAGLGGAFALLCGIGATWIVVDVIHPPGENVHGADRFLMVVSIVTVTYVAGRIAGLAMHGYARKNPGMLSSASLFASVARGTIVILGALIALQALGISITPLLTALGVGGLAVGLALQDTLANLFAGIQILAARLFRHGDFVRLASGQEGTIVDITWRSTIIRDVAGALVVVPNTTLSSSLVMNMTAEGVRLAVPFTVTTRTNLETLSSVVTESTRDYFASDAACLAEEPYVVFGAPADTTIPCTLCLHLTHTDKPFVVRSGVLRHVREALEAKGIEPFAQPA
jgi:small-conductance mechanosensitive channel